MKLFIADSRKKGRISDTDYHWCDDDDILMFCEFQTETNRKRDEISMVGIQSRMGTTHIIVKELDIPKEYLLELLIESVEKALECEVNPDGSYIIDTGGGMKIDFNINDRLNELTDKASLFKDGEKVYCVGRVIHSCN